MSLLDILSVAVAGALTGTVMGIMHHGGYIDKIVDYIERLGK